MASPENVKVLELLNQDLCNKRKVRCSGGPPCSLCAEKNLPCTFERFTKKRGPNRGQISLLNAQLKVLEYMYRLRGGVRADPSPPHGESSEAFGKKSKARVAYLERYLGLQAGYSPVALEQVAIHAGVAREVLDEFRTAVATTPQSPNQANPAPIQAIAPPSHAMRLPSANETDSSYSESYGHSETPLSSSRSSLSALVEASEGLDRGDTRGVGAHLFKVTRSREVNPPVVEESPALKALRIPQQPRTVFHGFKVPPQRHHAPERPPLSANSLRLQNNILTYSTDMLVNDATTVLWLRMYRDHFSFLFPIFPHHMFSQAANFAPSLLFSMIAIAARFHPDVEAGFAVAEAMFDRARKELQPAFQNGGPADIYTIATLSNLIVYIVTSNRRDVEHALMPFISYAAALARERKFSDEDGELFVDEERSEESKEIIRRLWWTLFNLDRTLSAGTARAFSISELECRLRLPSPNFPPSLASSKVAGSTAPLFVDAISMRSPLPPVLHYQARLVILNHIFGQISEFWQWASFNRLELFDPSGAPNPLTTEAHARHRKLDAALDWWWQELPEVYKEYIADITTAQHHFTYIMLFRAARVLLHAPRGVVRQLTTNEVIWANGDPVNEQKFAKQRVEIFGWLMSHNRKIASEEARLVTRATEIGLRASGGAVEWSGVNSPFFTTRETRSTNDFSFVEFGSPFAAFSLFHTGLVHIAEARVLAGLAGVPHDIGEVVNFQAGAQMDVLARRGRHNVHVGEHLRSAGIHVTALLRFGVAWLNAKRLGEMLNQLLEECVLSMTVAEVTQTEDTNAIIHQNSKLINWGDWILPETLREQLSTELGDVLASAIAV
ncbi:hypothetical protein M427DRAFT_131456 [Gonapodya prolifera JEL478]|uniref:Zn(2)-C6 fungal-type domain-containing protein n=1 Tax=Gonapodya prolifera (strain JEL478) TaxID=1344416 RepID=A0A139ATJ4_GONPJ|nr:hypothetical protein M427DRAFT_131456 [Gonapodya prolifera JEL478]|eukprot:KXS20014.1 hypothetical protein M427DRAFT_131456 [Gonapodya prolifera JEL478]